MRRLFKTKKEINLTNSDIDMENIPIHIGIIMDGNGRWAKAKHLPRMEGHKAGAEALRDIVKECNKLQVKYLTIYAFSTENWKRPTEEVNGLMRLLVEYLKKEVGQLNKENVVVNHIGDISKLPLNCQKELETAYEKTKNNTGLVLNMALNYGGRDEIVQAFKRIHMDILDNKLTVNDVDNEVISRYLFTYGIPDPEIIIRTSGEQRLSNFFLWQCAYSEFWYTNTNWPDFKPEHLLKSISDYQKRERRFGGIK